MGIISTVLPFFISEQLLGKIWKKFHASTKKWTSQKKYGAPNYPLRFEAKIWNMTISHRNKYYWLIDNVIW